MQDAENTYMMLAHRIQHAIDTDDVSDLRDCAELIEIKRMHFVEADENSERKIVKPISVYAAEHGSVEVMRLLLAEGCEINAQDSFGNTPLMMAVECDKIEMVRFLSKQSSVHLDMKNYYGETIHSIALLNKDAVVIQYLKELEKPLMFDAVSFQLTDTSTSDSLTRH